VSALHHFVLRRARDDPEDCRHFHSIVRFGSRPTLVGLNGLVPILRDYALPSRPMHLVYPPDRRPAPKLRAFIDLVVGRLGEDRLAADLT
jgi:DNA-binding transcriptional LysR family regulator